MNRRDASYWVAIGEAQLYMSAYHALIQSDYRTRIRRRISSTGTDQKCHRLTRCLHTDCAIEVTSAVAGYKCDEVEDKSCFDALRTVSA